MPSGSRAANPNQSTMIERYLSSETLQKAERLKKIADEAGFLLSNLALAWILRQPGVSSAIIGASRPEQIEENSKAVEIQLSEDLLSAIDAVLQA